MSTTTNSSSTTTNSSTQTLSLSPPPSALTKHTDPSNNTTHYAFPLQTKAWLHMQVLVRHALSFPITAEDFTTQYGTFTDEASITDAVAVLKKLHTTANQYGDPQTLISKISSFQSAKKPPSPIYGHGVWLAAQIQTAAQQIGALLNSGLSDIGKTADARMRISDLKSLLTGKGGVTDQAATIKTKIDKYSTAVSDFYSTLQADLTGPTDSLETYLGQSHNVLTQAENDVTADNLEIHQIHDNIDTLNDEYIGFTIAAGLAPVFLLVPFFGPFLAIADAATFVTLAIEVHKELVKAKARLANEKAEKQKKVSLVTQLKLFNASSSVVESQGASFLNTLGQMTAGWTEFVSQINKRLNTLTVRDVEDWSAFLTRVNFQASLNQWNLVASKAEDFFTKGFVKFDPQSGS